MKSFSMGKDEKVKADSVLRGIEGAGKKMSKNRSHRFYSLCGCGRHEIHKIAFIRSDMVTVIQPLEKAEAPYEVEYLAPKKCSGEHVSDTDGISITKYTHFAYSGISGSDSWKDPFTAGFMTVFPVYSAGLLPLGEMTTTAIGVMASATLVGTFIGKRLRTDQKQRKLIEESGSESLTIKDMVFSRLLELSEDEILDYVSLASTLDDTRTRIQEGEELLEKISLLEQPSEENPFKESLERELVSLRDDEEDKAQQLSFFDEKVNRHIEDKLNQEVINYLTR